MPDSIWRKYFDAPSDMARAKAAIDPLKHSTFAYIECQIAKDLHMSLEAYHKLSRKERFTWLIFTLLGSEKENAQIEESKRTAELESQRSRASATPSHFR